MSVDDASRSRAIPTRVFIACIVFSLVWAVYPFARAAFRVEVDYNEGWNVYNAARVANHQQLYPVAYGWQSVNYPMLSFAMMAGLHHLTHDYLFTARALSLLSLLGCCILVTLIVRQIAGTDSAGRRAALLAGFLCLVTFCTDADKYVGMDDPQLLANVLFLLGFFVYVRDRSNFAAVTLSAALLVVAGSIKHNPLDVPLTVVLDVVMLRGLRGLPRGLWFMTVGIAGAALSIYLNLRFGGPYFVTEMLAPRTWSVLKVLQGVEESLGPLLIPMVVALIAAVTMLRDPKRRVVGIFFLAALAVGGLFGGGLGVSTNTFFDSFFAMAMVLGVVMADLERGRYGWAGRSVGAVKLRDCFVPVMFGWMVIPAVVAGVWNPVAMLRQTVAEQREFDGEVTFLKQRSAPVLCESLLRCYFAGQPYVYDPFNATRLIRFRKLDAGLVVAGLDRGTYSGVQFDQSPDALAVEEERFAPEILRSIRSHYHRVLVGEDAWIEVPGAASP